MSSSKPILLLGSTGSIGVNALNCVRNCKDRFQVVGLSSHSNIQRLKEQALEFRPQFVAITGKECDKSDRDFFASRDISLFTGKNALIELVDAADFDLLVNAVVGAAGFLPTLEAIDRGKDIALANKETLVIGGQIVMERVKQHGVQVLPIDSEHSAIFQSLMGEDYSAIEEILLTASGGPFRNLPKEQLKTVTVQDALNHPNWSMGSKITIDSATMMNKGLEVIEAHWLFGVAAEKIRVVVHPQSIIHSMVTFRDGSIKAQLGVPDMKVPIQLAMTYPERCASDFPRLDFSTLKSLAFDVPDFNKFQCLTLAYEALRRGGTAPAVLNAANEVAVSLFLNQQIPFLAIPEIIKKAMSEHDYVKEVSVPILLNADKWAREFARNFATGIFK